MKFTTPCFVRVEDAEKRKRLIEWLFDIGYELCDHLKGVDGDAPVVVAAFGKVDLWVRTHCKSEICFDCGENIELFKALAAMREGPEITEQYMYATADLFTAKSLNGALSGKIKCMAKKGQLLKAERLSGLYFESMRKATAEEIIEHFKNKKK